MNDNTYSCDRQPEVLMSDDFRTHGMNRLKVRDFREHGIYWNSCKLFTGWELIDQHQSCVYCDNLNPMISFAFHHSCPTSRCSVPQETLVPNWQASTERSGILNKWKRRIVFCVPIRRDKSMCGYLLLVSRKSVLTRDISALMSSTMLSSLCENGSCQHTHTHTHARVGQPWT